MSTGKHKPDKSNADKEKPSKVSIFDLLANRRIVTVPHRRNSAARLLAVLHGIPSNQSLVEILPNHLGTDTQDPGERVQLCFAFFSAVQYEYQQFKQDVLASSMEDEERNEYINGLKKIEDTIYPSNFSGQFRPLEKAEIALLRVCATRIPEEGEVDQNDIEQIRASISELRSVVESSKTSKPLRRALLELIRLSEDSISRFAIHGAREFKKAFKAMLAETLELYATPDNEKDQDESWWSAASAKIKKHLELFDAIAAKTLQYKPLIEWAMPLLLTGK